MRGSADERNVLLETYMAACTHALILSCTKEKKIMISIIAHKTDGNVGKVENFFCSFINLF